jgi:hypothetical protein
MVTMGLKAVNILKKKNVLMRAKKTMTIMRILLMSYAGPMEFCKMRVMMEDQM